LLSETKKIGIRGDNRKPDLRIFPDGFVGSKAGEACIENMNRIGEKRGKPAYKLRRKSRIKE